MTIRSKILAAALGLAMAGGTIGGAFAQTSDAAETPAAPVATTSAPKPTVAPKTHRFHIVHRGLKTKVSAHRVVPSAKVATKIGTPKIGTTKIGTKTHLVRSHLAKTHLAKGRLAKTHLAKTHLAKTQPTKTSSSKIRVSKTSISGQKHAMVAKKTIVR